MQFKILMCASQGMPPFTVRVPSPEKQESIQGHFGVMK